MRLGKPLRQMRMPSKTPLQRSWCITKGLSITPGVVGEKAAWSASGPATPHHKDITPFSSPGSFRSLGMRHRTKWGWVVLRLVISLLRFSWEWRRGLAKGKELWGRGWSHMGLIPGAEQTLSGRRNLSSWLLCPSLHHHLEIKDDSMGNCLLHPPTHHPLPNHPPVSAPA